MGKGKSSTVVGHSYFMGCAYGLCEKVGKLLAFKFNGDIVARPNLSTSGSFDAQTGKSAPSHGSGNKSSSVKFYNGLQTTPDEYLTRQTGYELAYKKLAYFVVNGFIGDNVSSLPEYSCVVENTALGVGSNENINGDINPAWALYYILTKLIGISADELDYNSFSSCASALYNDGFGMSFTMSSANEAKEWIEEILRTIDAVLCVNPSTGKMKLKLLRYDFKESDLRLVNESKCKDLVFKRKAWDDTFSRVSVKYTRRGNYEFKEDIVTAINNAVKETLGYEKSESVEYMAITNATNAGKVLNRLMRKLTYPYASLTFKLSSEEFKNLEVGDVMLFSHKNLGVKDLKIRVLNLGADKEDDQSVEVEAVEDVFSLQNLHITSEQPSLYEPIDLNVGEIQHYGAIEATIEMGEEQGILPMVTKPSGFVQGVSCKDGAQGRSLNCQFFELGELDAPLSAGAEFSDEAYFDIKEITPLWAVSATRAGFQRLKMTCAIDSELINFEFREDLGGGKWRIKTLMRGLSGTAITSHRKGAKVWFAPVDANDLVMLPIISPNTTLHFKAYNYVNESGTKSLNFSHSGRAKRAYAPSNVWGERNGSTVTLHWRNCVRLRGANYRNADNIEAGADEGLQEGATIITYNGVRVEVSTGESWRIENAPNNTTFTLYAIGLNGEAYKSDSVSVRV
ncbi:phage tail protein [Campylobacter sp. VBCF_06 NA8]|uniref:phage tail protein n=1 Tax=Campylobacter sp. VBCF_06 NA8 TaxID=2983822 RepID=UPI0022E9A105|nr:phage tail protein [Campylobacter sp. VBCF_06 NA8]MDA3046690.1 phage tail protein [Campylobacter sp. VBCF_06 NA8]